MPAAARKRYPTVVPDERTHGAHRPASAGRPLRNPHARRQTATAPAPAYDWQVSPLTASAQRQLDERIDPAYESFLEASAKARTARRRARRRHQPFRLTWQASVACCVLMAQLVALLWMQGVTLAARNRSYKLDKDIADRYSAVTRTQKEIAGRASAARIAAWANERGWQVASQDKLDSVTNLTPVTENETDPAAAATTPVAVSIASNGKHKGHGAHQRHQVVPVKVEIQATNEANATGDGTASGDTLPATDSQTTRNDTSISSPQVGDD